MTDKKCLHGIAILVVSLIYSFPALCDYVVMGSQSKTIEVGSEIQDTTVVDIGDQEKLRLLDKKSVETRILIGPYKGTVGNYSASPPKERSKSIGATRSLRQDP